MKEQSKCKWRDFKWGENNWNRCYDVLSDRQVVKLPLDTFLLARPSQDVSLLPLIPWIDQGGSLLLITLLYDLLTASPFYVKWENWLPIHFLNDIIAIWFFRNVFSILYWAGVVAQLAEQSLTIPEVCSSNAVTKKIIYGTFIYSKVLKCQK